MQQILIVAGLSLGILLLAVLAMSIGVLFKRKPIQHCGSSSIEYKGKRIDCPICQGSKDACENPPGRPVVYTD